MDQTQKGTLVPSKIIQTFPMLIAVFTMATIAAAIWAMGQQERSGHVQTLDDGLTTCFSRVTQSFTAKMIGDKNSDYLRTSFFRDTEDCFGEIIRFSQINLSSKRDKPFALALNQLSSEVHAFHEFLRPAAGFSQKDQAQFPERFAKLEQQKYGVDDHLGTTKGRINKYMRRISKVVGAGAFIVGTLSLLLLIHARGKSKRRRELELMARQQLGEGQYADQGAVKQIIVSAMSTLESDLLNRLTLETLIPASAHSSQEQMAGGDISQYAPPRREEELQLDLNWNALQLGNHEQEDCDGHQVQNVYKWDQRKNTDIQTKDDGAVTTDGMVSIPEIIAQAIDHFSPKIFSAGILVNLDTDEAQTNHERELLAQIVFELFADMMSNINSQASSSLSVELKKRDGQVNLNFFKTCALWQQTEVENNHIRIVRELVKDCAGELFIKDATDASGVVIGRSYHVNFPLMREKRQGANAGKRVTSVRKGRKRELMAEMN